MATLLKPGQRQLFSQDTKNLIIGSQHHALHFTLVQDWQGEKTEKWHISCIWTETTLNCWKLSISSTSLHSHHTYCFSWIRYQRKLEQFKSHPIHLLQSTYSISLKHPVLTLQHSCCHLGQEFMNRSIRLRSLPANTCRNLAVSKQQAGNLPVSRSPL